MAEEHQYCPPNGTTPSIPFLKNSADFLILSDKRLISYCCIELHTCNRNNYGDIDWVIHMHSLYVLLSITCCVILIISGSHVEYVVILISEAEINLK